MSFLSRLYKKEGAFAVALFGDSVFSFDALTEGNLIYKLDIKGLWKPKPVLYQADAFLFVKGDSLFLFYELQHWDNPGVIVMRKTNDLNSWTEPVVVLQQPYHLSFPFVFEDNGHVFMIPESQESDAIHLFRADNDDLTSFSKVRTLLYRERTRDIHYNFNDSHIFKKDSIYYLFTSFQKNWMYYQELYMTGDLLNGEFVCHPKSPVCVNNEFGRNAGSLINVNGKLFRVTQDCHADYGDNVSLMEIDVLSPDDYREHVFRRKVLPNNTIFNQGGHQLNVARFKGKYVYATDYKQNRWAWYKLWIALLTKLKLHKHRG